MTLLLIAAAAFLAFSNGANDNFKGVASLYGSGVASYRAALTWATVTTAAGSLFALILAETLLHRFTGKGLVPDALVASPSFVLAVAFAAAGTVLLATRLGFPVSTTHALLGAMGGAGLAIGGPSALNFVALNKGFLAPLLLSPVLAIALGGTVFLLVNRVRTRLGARGEVCLCVGLDGPDPGWPAGDGTATLPSAARPLLRVRPMPVEACALQTPGTVAALDLSRAFTGLHWVSAGAVSFARGLNDTPKIAALLLIARAVAPAWDVALVAGAMAAGGVVGARRVAETLSHRITRLDPTEGLVANLSTAALVLSASVFGLPVSTTHVSVGSLFGIALTTRQADYKVMQGIVLSWAITLPCAAVVGAVLARLFAAGGI